MCAHADNSHPASHKPHKISNSRKIFPDPYSCLSLHKYKTASGGGGSNPQAEEQIPKCINRAATPLSLNSSSEITGAGKLIHN